MKFGLALIQVGLGFLVLVWGVQFADDSYRVPLFFLALAYLLHTTGELCLSPVGPVGSDQAVTGGGGQLHDGGLVPVQCVCPICRRA